MSIFVLLHVCEKQVELGSLLLFFLCATTRSHMEGWWYIIFLQRDQSTTFDIILIVSFPDQHLGDFWLTIDEVF